LIVRFAGPEGEVRRQFDYSPVTIGRDPGCECLVDDRTVSNRHAQFSYHHNQWWLVDLGSTNGTVLNGQPVTEAVVLINDDQVQCGQVNLAVTMVLDRGEATSEFRRGQESV
jgi:pSer/pThr/pTyr-binding forkhead associated (FHA) protein